MGLSLAHRHPPDEIQTGAALMTELGQFGPGGQALYDPRPD